jgi:two-component system, OmpR family, sensor kinase
MSLAARLSTFFLAALAVVLVGFSVSLFLLARTYLHRQVEQRLQAAVDALAAASEVEDGAVEWEPLDHPLLPGQDTGAEQVRWTAYDEAGHVVDRSRNLDGADLLEQFPGAALDGEHALYLSSRSGVPWGLLQRRLQSAHPDQAMLATPDPTPGKSRHQALLLTAGLCLTPLHTSLHILAAVLTGLSLGLWLLAALLGRWLCGRGLRPLTEMATAARAMNASDLGQRLPSPGTRDELEDLGGAFNDLLARVQEAFERQRRFTGDASHQLRTPLTALLGEAEVVLRHERSAQEYREALARAHGQALHLRQIVEMLLFLARADAEAALDALETVDLAVWLPAHLRRWSAHPRSADLHAAVSAGSLPVRAQGPLLGQLLDNLLDNACKYSRPGTPITVRLQEEKGMAALSVEDGGCGVAAEDVPHIFEPFYRSASVRRLGRTGVGLGLAVARRIATAFGGTLTVDSTVGVGSRFTLRLPLAG